MTSPETLASTFADLQIHPAVLQAVKNAGRGPIPAHVEKYTLRLSGLGRELWAASAGSRDTR